MQIKRDFFSQKVLPSTPINVKRQKHKKNRPATDRSGNGVVTEWYCKHPENNTGLDADREDNKDGFPFESTVALCGIYTRLTFFAKAKGFSI